MPLLHNNRSSAEIHDKTLVITICLRCSALLPNYCCCLGFGVCVVLARPFGTVLRRCSVTLQTFKITDFCQRHTPYSFLSNNWLQPREANFYLWRWRRGNPVLRCVIEAGDQAVWCMCSPYKSYKFCLKHRDGQLFNSSIRYKLWCLQTYTLKNETVWKASGLLETAGHEPTHSVSIQWWQGGRAAGLNFLYPKIFQQKVAASHQQDAGKHPPVT